jgi:hypothetical protein
VRRRFDVRDAEQEIDAEKVVYIDLALAKRTDGQQTTGDEVKGKSHHQH